jgi:phosphohistidine phosphatase
MAEIDFVIVRHAQAVDGSYVTADSERRLTPRGERDASSVGRVRKLLNLPHPDLVFTSGYERAEQTLERVLEGQVVSIVRDLSFSPEGSVETAWRLIAKAVTQQLAQAQGCVWVFGHNPNIERLISFLSPGVGAAVKPFRKASLAWLRVSFEDAGTPNVQLVAFIPRPHDPRDKSAQLDF